MPSIGNLFASLTLESTSFMSGLDAAVKKMTGSQAKFAGIGKSMMAAGAGMTAAITAPFAGLVAGSMDAATESAQALAQVRAAVDSMGPAAGRTVPQLQDLAGQLQSMSLFDDDDILKSVTANLLRFGNISGATFDKAQLAIVNYAARTGTDLQSATTLIGKALAAPEKSFGMLRKAGIAFTADQQAMIVKMAEAGNVAGAQGVVLEALAGKFRRAAQAQRDATPNAAQQQEWRTFQETLGKFGNEALKVVLPPLTALMKGFNSLSGPTQTAVIGIAAVGAAFGPATIAIGGIVGAVGKLLPIFTLLRGAIMTTAIPAITSFVVATAPVTVPIIAITAAIAGVVYAVRNWDKIKPYVDKVVGWMAGLYVGVKTWVLDKLNAVWDGVKAKVQAAGNYFRDLFYIPVVGNSYVPDTVREIGEWMAKLDGAMVQPAKRATQSAAEAFADLQQRVSGILERLFPEQAAENRWQAERKALTDYASAVPGAANMVTTALARLDTENIRNAFANLAPPDAPEQVVLLGGALSQLTSTTTEKFAKIAGANDNLRDSFATMVEGVGRSLEGLTRSIKSGDWLGALTGVLAVIEQLGGAGLFGKGFQARVTGGGLTGRRAMGGPVQPYGTYLVGERGPELLRMGGAGGNIVPNHEMGGPVTVQLVVGPGQMFEPVVAGISGAVSIETVRQTGARSAMRGRQRLGGRG